MCLVTAICVLRRDESEKHKFSCVLRRDESEKHIYVLRRSPIELFKVWVRVKLTRSPL